MKKLLLSAAALATLGMGANAYADHHMEKDADAHASVDVDVAGEKSDIVDTAASKAEFSTLVSALKAAELDGALKGDGPFTVFAPTNDAFAALPEGALADLLKPENKSKLQDVLKYHVVSGKILAGDIKDGSTDVGTLQGTTLNVQKTEDGVTVDGANVTAADVETSNGVIHVIDAVIMPE